MDTTTIPNKRVLLPVAILLLGSLLFAYLVATRPAARPNPPQEKEWPVRVIVARFQDLQPQLTVFGEIAAGREAEIRSMVAGRIVELDPDFKEGAVTKAGTLIARIDPFEYELSVEERSAELAEAEARLAELRHELESERKLLQAVDEQRVLRERDLERTQNLSRKGQASDKARDDAALAVNAAVQSQLERSQAIGRLNARVRQQEAAISRSAAALRRAERDLNDTRIVAPFDGYASDVSAALGKRIALGESLARLIEAASLEARFDLAYADYARLLARRGDARGMAVEVIWRVGDEAFSFPAEVARGDAEIDPTTGGIGQYAVIGRAPASGVLRPGAFVEVRIPDVRYEGVVALPETAVSDDGTVYVVDNGRLVSRRVEVLREFGDQVYVRGELADGARVVAEQFPDIGPGLRVNAL